MFNQGIYVFGGGGNSQSGTKYFAYDNTTYTYTGTIAITILKTIHIPPPSMGANSALEIFANFIKSGTAGNAAYVLYITTNPSAVAGGSSLQYIQPGATILNCGIWLRLINKNALNSQIQKSTSQAANIPQTAQTNAAVVRSIDFSVDQYVHIYAVAGSTADTQGITDYQCYIDEP